MKLYLSLFLVLTSLIACSTGGVKYKQKEDLPKNVVFYSDEDIFKIPLCNYTSLLCSNPKNCEPLSDEILKNLDELGTVIGEIQVYYFWKNYKTYSYIVKDKSTGYLFIKKNYFTYYKPIIEQSEYKAILTGEINGLTIDIDLHNARLDRNAKSILFLVTLKNSSSQNITFNSSTNKTSVFFGSKKNKIENELFACNFCTLQARDFVKEILPGEEKEFFAKLPIEDENEKLRLQMGIMFTKIIIDGLTDEKNKPGPADIRENEKKLRDVWGGYFINSKNNITIPLKAQIKPNISGK